MDCKRKHRPVTKSIGFNDFEAIELSVDLYSKPQSLHIKQRKLMIVVCMVVGLLLTVIV